MRAVAHKVSICSTMTTTDRVGADAAAGVLMVGGAGGRCHVRRLYWKD